MLNKYYEIYLHTIRLQSLLEEVDKPQIGLTKAVRTINSFVENAAETFENANSEAHGLVVHNYNLIHDRLSNEILETAII